jgi:hypothetical protein
LVRLDIFKTPRIFRFWQTKLSKILQDYSPDQIYNGDETDIFYRLFLRSYKISLDQIYNANETGIFYRLLPDKTLEFKNVSCHSGKLSKDRYSFVCQFSIAIEFVSIEFASPQTHLKLIS